MFGGIYRLPENVSHPGEDWDAGEGQHLKIR